MFNLTFFHWYITKGTHFVVYDYYEKNSIQIFKDEIKVIKRNKQYKHFLTFFAVLERPLRADKSNFLCDILNEILLMISFAQIYKFNREQKQMETNDINCSFGWDTCPFLYQYLLNLSLNLTLLTIKSVENMRMVPKQTKIVNLNHPFDTERVLILSHFHFLASHGKSPNLGIFPMHYFFTHSLTDLVVWMIVWASRMMAQSLFSIPLCPQPLEVFWRHQVGHFLRKRRDLDTITDSITLYICFCEENIVQTKRIKVYANSKPWVNRELKTILLEKRKAFFEGDKQEQHQLEKEFKLKNKQSRRQYKDKVEKKLTEGQGRMAWDGLNTMMGKNTKKQELKCNDPLTFANDLNVFYSRFDSTDFSRQIDNIYQPLLTIPNNIRVTESDVKKVFSQLKPRKAFGPDGVGGKVLRACSSSLSPVFCNLFQILLNLHYVPCVWRTSSIIQVSKSSHAKDLNDFRPIALTSVICKSLEKIGCNYLTASVANRMDRLQFAYKA